MKFDTSEMIDITGVDLKELVKKAYELSNPQGMGYIHFREGPLSDADAQAILDIQQPSYGAILSMDYVKGRSVKLTVFQQDDKLYVRNDWFDHSEDQLKELLRYLNVGERNAE